MAVHRDKGVGVISLASGNRHKIAGFVIPFPTGDGLHDLAGIAVPRDQIALGVDGDVAAAVGLMKSLVSVVLVGGTYFVAYKKFNYRIF